MAKFKVGDRVRGNVLATENYNMTRQGYEGVISSIDLDGYITIDSYIVDPKCFDLVEKVPVLKPGSKVSPGQIYKTKLCGEYWKIDSYDPYSMTFRCICKSDGGVWYGTEKRILELSEYIGDYIPTLGSCSSTYYATYDTLYRSYFGCVASVGDDDYYNQIEEDLRKL